MTKLPTRLSIYGVAVHEDAILLCRIASGYPGEGMWTLPGGGIEWGEHPLDALRREIHEETGLDLGGYEHLGIDARVYEGGKYPDGIHVVRMIYRTPLSGAPSVTEVDGSVDACRWVPLSELDELPTVNLVRAALEIAGIEIT
ncbi:MAG: NUDIX domain-containing protein [Actinomycetota bacterium]